MKKPFAKKPAAKKPAAKTAAASATPSNLAGLQAARAKANAAAAEAEAKRLADAAAEDGADDDEDEDDDAEASAETGEEDDDGEADASAEAGDEEDDDDAEASAEDADDEDDAGDGKGKDSKAAKAERTRIAGILRSDAAKGREAAAMALALDTAVTAKQARGILKTMPLAKAGGGLTQHMRALGRTPVAAGGKAGGAADSVDAVAARIVSA